jgi:hypothetical protein
MKEFLRFLALSIFRNFNLVIAYKHEYMNNEENNGAIVIIIKLQIA